MRSLTIVLRNSFEDRLRLRGRDRSPDVLERASRFGRRIRIGFFFLGGLGFDQPGDVEGSVVAIQREIGTARLGGRLGGVLVLVLNWFCRFRDFL